MSKAAKALKSTADGTPAQPSGGKNAKVNVPKTTTTPIAPPKSVADRLASVREQLHVDHKPTLAEQKIVEEPPKPATVATPAPVQGFTSAPPPVHMTQQRNAPYQQPPRPRQPGDEYHVSTTGIQSQPYKPEVRDEKGQVVQPTNTSLPPGYSIGTGGMKVKNL